MSIKNWTKNLYSGAGHPHALKTKCENRIIENVESAPMIRHMLAALKVSFYSSFFCRRLYLWFIRNFGLTFYIIHIWDQLIFLILKNLLLIFYSYLYYFKHGLVCAYTFTSNIQRYFLQARRAHWLIGHCLSLYPWYL